MAVESRARKRARPPFGARRLQRVKARLRRTFGLKNLREGQAEVNASVLDGQDTLAIMPTGAGKSPCYPLPALELPGTTVVVSPLISLMKDQVDKRDELGVNASQVNSALTAREAADTLEQHRRFRKEFAATSSRGDA